MTGAVTQDKLAARADANLRAYAAAWARTCPGGDAWADETVAVAASGVPPQRAFNQAFMLRPPPQGDGSLARVREYFRGRGVPCRLRALESQAVDEALLATAGFQRDGGIPTLVLQPMLDAPQPPPGVEITRVSDAASLRALVETFATSFEFSRDALEQVFTTRLIEDQRWRGYVACIDGAAVATSQLFVHEAVAGIYYVGTLEAYRGRGVGEAVTWRCIRDGAAAGCDIASLQASPQGQPVYERMGFRQVGYYRTYIPQEA